MDPQYCFEAWINCVKDGDLDGASAYQENYEAWIKRGGFPAEEEDCLVLRLDLEQDRFLVSNYGKEEWRAVDE